MKRLSIAGLGLSLAIAAIVPVWAGQVSLNDALVLSFDDRGEQEQDVFKANRCYMLQGGQVAFTAESGGNCTIFIPEENIQVSEKCSEFGTKMQASAQKMRARMGVTDEQMAMMKKFGGGEGQQDPLKKIGIETIAGEKAVCFSNSLRKVCVSKPVGEKIREEGFDSRELAKNLAESDMEMDIDSQENEQLLEIYQMGYPVLDMETATTPAIPGWGFLDEATKKRIMAQMGNAGSGGESGRKLLSIERKSVTFEVPQLEQVSIEGMMNRMMK